MPKVNTNSISVVGLGKLGLCLASAFSSKGIQVLGVDINKKIVDSVNKAKAPWYEPNLQRYLKKYKRNLKATLNHKEAIDGTDISIILVETPSDSYGSFSSGYVETAFKQLANLLKKNGKEYHLFILSSTVMPTSIKRHFIPLIEKESGRKFKKDFGFSFVPDFVALGKVIDDFISPDFVMIGEEDKLSGDTTESLYRKLVGKRTLIKRLSFTEAELAKVALNCYITTKISFANSLANLCELLPGVNVDNITETISQDKRISSYYLKGGPSFGGTCFPRDIRAYIALAKMNDVQYELMKAVGLVNKKQNKYIVNLIKRYSKGVDNDVLILGTAFKQDTPVMDESVAMNVIPELLKMNIKVSYHDKWASNETRKIFGKKVRLLRKKSEFFKKPRLILLPIASSFYKSLDFSKAKKGSVIIDCWRFVDKNKLRQGVKYIVLGSSDD